MADPVTAGMAIIGGASSLGGSLMQAQGAKAQGEATAQQLMYQAGIAKQNQKISLQNADYERWAGEVSAQQSGIKTAATIATTKARQGASGADVNTGSAVDIRNSERLVGEEDMAMIRANAARKAYGYDVEAWRYGTEAAFGPTAASNARTAASISADASILGGIGSVSSKWLSASSAFGTGSNSGWVGDSGHSGWIDNPDTRLVS